MLILVVVALFSQMLSNVVFAQEVQSSGRSSQAKYVGENAKVYAALEQPANLEFDETPWSEIEEELQRRYKINIVLTVSARDDSLTEDEPFIANFSGINLRQALNMMLAEKNATISVKSGVLLIISKDDVYFHEYLGNTFINVRPLLAKIRELEKDRIGKPRVRNLQPLVPVPVVGAAGKGGGLFSVKTKSLKAVTSTENSSTEDDDAKDDEKVVHFETITAESLLLDMIHTTVDPDSWAENGGVGTSGIIGGILVVQTPEILADRVRKFLDDLSVHIMEP